MEFTEKDRIRYKQMLLSAFCSFSNICEANHIQYFVAGGTLIGSIRHKGFIPWDDDIDVLMPREDYVRFAKICKEITDSEYELLDIDSPGYYLPFAKYSHKNSTLLEVENLPCEFGVYVDIFILDYTDLSEPQFAQKKRIYDYLSKLLVLSSISHNFSSGFLELISGNLKKAGWHLFQSLVLRPLRPIIKYSLKSFIPNQKSGKAAVSYAGGYKNKEYCDSSYFQSSIKKEFENIFINVPVGYHDYLTNIFGDYMKLPPVEKRQSHHSHYYYNLDRRVSIEEIKEIMRNNE